MTRGRLFTCNSQLFISLLVIFISINCAKFTSSEAGCTTSCGNLNNIHFPFRVRGDPKHCGDPQYELVCEGGEASLCFGSHNYLVTSLRYDSTKLIRQGSLKVHFDCPLTNSTCRLNHTNYCVDEDIYTFMLEQYSWASFMSCSQKIEKKEYMFLPFGQVNRYDYVVLGDEANKLSYLHESCKFVDVFPVAYDLLGINSSMLFIEALHKGFDMSWGDHFYAPSNCWSAALRFANNILEYAYENRNLGLLALATYLYPSIFFLYFFYCPSDKACNDSNKCNNIFQGIPLVLIFFFVVLLELVIAQKVASFLIFWVYLLYNCWRNTRSKDAIEIFLQKEVLLPRRYTYGEITVMTRHFREKIGKGGFGQVYKGEIFGGYPVAVKVLDGLKFNGEEFINEVSTIGRIHHLNIVQLLGFCSDGTKRALIYEYMSNGSLDKHIFSSDGHMDLSIEKLNNIALGIAKGVNYLHTGCDMQILHFDIKPHNVLLDDNFIPKISDFGMAKLYPKEQGLVSVSIARGTIGYIAPELISRSFGVISHKSDVYSFGMLILEIAGRRKNVDTRVTNSNEIYYPSWIFDQLIQLESLNVNEIIAIGEIEVRLCKLGLWCIQMNPSNRPTMSEVIKLLESTVDEIKMPPKPFCFSSDAITTSHICTYSSASLPILVEEDDMSLANLV